MALIKAAAVMAQVNKLTEANKDEVLLMLLGECTGTQLQKTNALVNPTTTNQIAAILEELDVDQLHYVRNEVLALLEDQASE